MSPAVFDVTMLVALNLLVLFANFLALNRQAQPAAGRLPVRSCRMQRGNDVKGVTHYGR